MGNCPGGELSGVGIVQMGLILTSKKKEELPEPLSGPWTPVDPVNENPGSALGDVSLEDTDENGQFSHFTESKCNIKKRKTRRAALHVIMYIFYSLSLLFYIHTYMVGAIIKDWR